MNGIMKCLSTLCIKSGILYLCILFVFPLSVRSQSTGMINGHEYVDLGLPSGLKWATCNVGASRPEDYGDYYAWGETLLKPIYEEFTSITYGKRLGNISKDHRYDVARSEWGSSWRLPTKGECEELLKKCKWEWTVVGGHNGYRVTGPNGNFIFLPATGMNFGSCVVIEDEFGYYWTASPIRRGATKAYTLVIHAGYHSVDGYIRYRGQGVRPVSD